MKLWTLYFIRTSLIYKLLSSKNLEARAQRSTIKCKLGVYIGSGLGSTFGLDLRSAVRHRLALLDPGHCELC
jgi:hypothetical protein